jgi:hypothetical protein
MKTSAILIEAAKKVSESATSIWVSSTCVWVSSTCGCRAIEAIIRKRGIKYYGPKHREAIRFFRLIRPREIAQGYWWTMDNRRYDFQARVIGLLLAAAIAESEGD